MKKLDEYKAEILLRSEKKKAAIKTRNKRIVAAVIPLVICISAVMTAVVPSLMGASDADEILYETIDGEGVIIYEPSEQLKVDGFIATGNGNKYNGASPEGSYYIEFNRIEISEGENSESTTDVEKVRKLYKALMDYVGAESDYEREMYKQGCLSRDNYDIKITLYSKQNIAWVYIIDGNSLMLLTPSGECKVALPEAEMNKLIKSIRS